MISPDELFDADTEKDMWRYGSLLPDCPAAEYQLEGPRITPVVPFEHSDTGSCFLKREDFHSAGSHKSRAACFQVSRQQKDNPEALVIPSSGNAAIAISEYSQKTCMKTLAFLSVSVPNAKAAAVLHRNGLVLLCSKPVNFAAYISRIFRLPNLRPSVDPDAVSGFMTLGFEIAAQIQHREVSTVFIFSTSGASLLGIIRAFEILNGRYSGFLRYPLPSLHAVQSGRSNELARHFDPRCVPVDDTILAGFGGLAASRLTAQIIPVLEKNQGSAWAVGQQEIEWGADMLDRAGYRTSFEGGACLAAVRRWRSSGGTGRALIILTGRHYEPDASDAPAGSIRLETYKDSLEAVTMILGCHDSRVENEMD